MLNWLLIGFILLVVWYVASKFQDEVFTAIDRRLYPEDYKV